MKKHPDNLRLRDMDTPTVLGYELDRDTLTPRRGTLPAPAKLPIGTRVSYADINLRPGFRGEVIAVGPTLGGGDCTVRWEARGGIREITSGECARNLVRVD